MSEPMTTEQCRAQQRDCSSAVRAEVAAVREMVQTMDRERGANSVRFEQLIRDVVEIKLNVNVIRKEADALYAIKLTERIAFGLVGLVCVGVVTAVIKLVIK